MYQEIDEGGKLNMIFRGLIFGIFLRELLMSIEFRSREKKMP
jgi:hypothetical protein